MKHVREVGRIQLVKSVHHDLDEDRIEGRHGKEETEKGDVIGVRMESNVQ